MSTITTEPSGLRALIITVWEKSMLLQYSNITFFFVAAPRSCTSQEFRCVTSGECISSAFVCDGEEDCIDGSDEQRNCGMSSDCERRVKNTDAESLRNALFKKIKIHAFDLVLGGRTCSPDQFTCQEGQCIPAKHRCDHVKDCVDNSDENNCSMLIYLFNPLYIGPVNRVTEWEGSVGVHCLSQGHLGSA